MTVGIIVGMGGPVLLGGYAAKQCPVRTQIEFLPLLTVQGREPTPEEQARRQAGRLFEDGIVARLVAVNPGAVLIGADLRRQDAIAATVAAMDARAPQILGGWLPDDEAGGRKGRPDILIRHGDGYLPAEVKNHRTLTEAKTKHTEVSLLESPGVRFPLAGWSSSTTHRFDDGIQLAHYTRMLQAIGRHVGPLIGAVVGTSEVAPSEGADPDVVFVWHDLLTPSFETFSRSEGKKKRSLLERYDHEHAFRVDVAATALRIVGGPDDPDPLVSPIGQTECAECPFDQWCQEQMGPDDPSAAITIRRLPPRAYLALRRLGITTTSALSAVDPEDPEFFERYYGEVSNLSRKQARDKLALAVRRAQMICEGISLSRHDTPLVVPAADIEIDLDIENDAENRVYMWGVRVRQGIDDSTARYLTDFIAWEPLDSTGERDLAQRFVDWLREQCRSAAAAGRSVAVFHWSHHEATRLRSILGLAAVADLIDTQTGVFVDLRAVFEGAFFSLHGAKLKVVAPIFGFHWRVADPGGGVSQVYLSAVHDGSDTEAAAAKRWLLTYNEDDTAATAAVRDGMRAWTG